MADTPKKKDATPTGDPLLNLHFAQAEAALAAQNGGLGPTTNEYVSSDEEENIDQATLPRDSQGFVRGQADSGIDGSHAGGHK